MSSLPPNIAPYVGTLPMWMLWVTVLFGFWKLVPQLRVISIKEAADLRAELQKCNEDCATKIAEAESKISRLNDDLLGEKRARHAEQIEFVNMMLEQTDSPDMRRTLKRLRDMHDRVAKRQPPPIVRVTLNEPDGE